SELLTSRSSHAKLGARSSKLGTHRGKLPRFLQYPRQFALRIVAAEGGDGGAPALDTVGDELGGVADGAVGVAREDARPDGGGAPTPAEVVPAEAFQKIEDAGVALAEDALPGGALAADALDERLHFDLQRRSGKGSPAVAEGGPRRLAQVVENP